MRIQILNKQTNKHRRLEFQHPGDGASCEAAKRRGGGGRVEGGGGASVSIKRDRQRLSGAKRRDRYNRLGSRSSLPHGELDAILPQRVYPTSFSGGR